MWTDCSDRKVAAIEIFLNEIVGLEQIIGSTSNSWKKLTTISTNQVFILKHNGDGFQAHLYLLSIHLLLQF